MTFRVGSLFAGIGGFDLGLERTGGFQTSWFCEQDAYCTKVLNKHWPDVPVYPDITELKGTDVEPVDVLCGGFPCQDLSVAGKGAGLAGARSGLWAEYARLIGELRPRYVLVENVAALLARGMGTVLGDLAALGYDAEWDCIPASAVGAPHRRDRVWLVAYPDGESEPGGAVDAGQGRGLMVSGRKTDVADSAGVVRERSLGTRGTGGQPKEPASDGGADTRAVEHACGLRPVPRRTSEVNDGRRQPEHTSVEVADANSVAGSSPGSRNGGRGEVHGPGPVERVVGRGGSLGQRGPVEPDVCGMADGLSEGLDAHWANGEWPGTPRVAHGVPQRVDRLRALGNALVPQIAEWIGHRVLQHEAATRQGVAA